MFFVVRSKIFDVVVVVVVVVFAASTAAIAIFALNCIIADITFVINRVASLSILY